MLYEPAKPELGKNAITRRVNALREMNNAGGPQYRRYDRDGRTPVYLITVPSGEVRELTTKDVPAYVIALGDGYNGFRAHVSEALDSALSDPDVSDRDSLVQAVLSTLDVRCGDPLARAAAYFSSDAQPSAAAVA